MLAGGADDDIITAGEGQNKIWGGAGADTIHAQNGQYDVIYTDGEDTIHYDPGLDKIIMVTPTPSPVACPKGCVPAPIDGVQADLSGTTRRGRQLTLRRSLLFGQFRIMCPEGCAFDKHYQEEKDTRRRRQY